MTTKAELIKTDPALRYYQLDALLSIFLYAKCLVKMFCGVGKSIIITNVIIHGKKELNVIVFPSLALIMQYSMDYLLNEEKPYKKHFKKYTHINISSEKLENVNSTTDPKEIKKFLNKKGDKIVLVTYQSYHELLKCLDGKKIGLVCYDEAHHVTSPEYQKLVFFRHEHFEKEVFFTATPRNENGITMYDHDDPEKNMCGELAYNYTYLQGLKDEFLNAFQICIDMFTEDANVSLYEAMARAILERGTSRVLSFHSGVNGESNTNVWNFVNSEKFQEAFNNVQQSEFPEKNDYYKKITFKGMDGKTPAPERKRSLNELDNTPDNEIYIISSCETIGEGVDTKKANMCVFADPKSSITKIIQNIGRVVRPNPASPLSTILIPCFVDMEHYAAAQGDRVKTDELIREQMRATNGDYAPILNVLAALRQEDPELYDMCLNYPNKEHKEQSLNEQGYRIVEEDDYDGETYTPQEVEDMKEDGETPLEIHTNETIERFNMDSSEPLKRLYRDEEVYKPIVKMDDDYEEEDDDEEDDLQEIQPPKQKRIGMSIHHNSDIEMLWGVKEELDFNNKFCSVVIDCEVVKVNQMDIAIGIVERAEKRVANGGNLLPKHTNKISQEFKDASSLQQWKQCLKGNKTCHKLQENVKEYLDKELSGWSIDCFTDDKSLSCVKSIVSRALLRQNNGGNLMPTRVFKPQNNVENQERLDAQKLGLINDTLKGKGKKRDTVINYLNENLPGWNNNLEQVALKKAKCIIERAKQRLLNTDKQYLLPSTIFKPQNDEDKQERDDAIKLSEWKASLKNKGTSNLYDSVKKLLDEHLKGWSDEYSSLNHAKEIVIRAIQRKETGGRLLPTQYRLVKDKTKTTDPLILSKQQEYADSVKLGQWYNSLNGGSSSSVCCSDTIIYLDTHLPGWDDKAMVTLMNLVDRANIRRIAGKNILPKRHDIKKGKPDNRTENERVEDKDAKVIANLKRSVKKENKKYNTEKITKRCSYLDINLPEWSENFNTTTSSSILPQTPPPPPIKKNRKLKLVIIDDEPEEKGKLPIHHKTSAVGELHKIYRRMRSDTLHEKFKSDPQLWRDYHAIRNQNLASFDPASIPSNIIIQNLENDYMNLKRTKKVADMGCGQAPIAHYFRNKTDKHQRFDFYNYDHQSDGDPIISETDISSLPLEDETIEIAIMSLALWGTSENCTQYIKEAYRILEKGGGSRFYIIDCTNKWSTTPENAGQLLRTLLTTNGFDIIENKTDIGDKFCLFVCSKN